MITSMVSVIAVALGIALLAGMAIIPTWCEFEQA